MRLVLKNYGSLLLKAEVHGQRYRRIDSIKMLSTTLHMKIWARFVRSFNVATIDANMATVKRARWSLFARGCFSVRRFLLQFLDRGGRGKLFDHDEGCTC